MVDLPPLGGALARSAASSARSSASCSGSTSRRCRSRVPTLVLHDLEVPQASRSPMPIMPFCDLILSVFPVAWIFGRSGCSVVHDHQGMKAPAGSFLAVAFGRAGAASSTISARPGIELRYGNCPALRPRSPRDDVHRHPRVAARAHVAARSSRPARTSRRSRSPTRPSASRWTSSASATSSRPTRATAALTPAQWTCVALFVFGLVMVAPGSPDQGERQGPARHGGLPRPGELPADAAERVARLAQPGGGGERRELEAAEARRGAEPSEMARCGAVSTCGLGAREPAQKQVRCAKGRPQSPPARSI